MIHQKPGTIAFATGLAGVPADMYVLPFFGLIIPLRIYRRFKESSSS